MKKAKAKVREKQDREKRPKRKKGKEQTGRSSAKRGFLAVAIEKNNSKALLECFYAAYLIRKREAEVKTSIIISAENRQLAEWSGLFDHILVYENGKGHGRGLRAMISGTASELIYLPPHHLKSHLASLFTGRRIRLGGIQNPLLAPFHSNHLGNPLHLEKLKKMGYNLFPEPISLRFKGKRPSPPKSLPANFVWLSLFDPHDLNSNWPATHAARLLRLLASINLEAVLPLPDISAETSKVRKGSSAGEREAKPTSKLSEEIQYLKRCGARLHLLNFPTTLERINAMAQSSVVIGASGQETLWAHLLCRPVIALHDMRSFLPAPALIRTPLPSQNSPQSGSPPKGQSRQIEAQEKASWNGHKELYPPLSSYIRFSHLFEKQIIPSVERCIENCSSCEFRSCVDYLSPERVFQSLRQILDP